MNEIDFNEYTHEVMKKALYKYSSTQSKYSNYFTIKTQTVQHNNMEPNFLDVKEGLTDILSQQFSHLEQLALQYNNCQKYIEYYSKDDAISLHINKIKTLQARLDEVYSVIKNYSVSIQRRDSFITGMLYQEYYCEIKGSGYEQKIEWFNINDDSPFGVGKKEIKEIIKEPHPFEIGDIVFNNSSKNIGVYYKITKLKHSKTGSPLFDADYMFDKSVQKTQKSRILGQLGNYDFRNSPCFRFSKLEKSLHAAVLSKHPYTQIFF